MEEPGGLQSMGSQSQTRLSDFTLGSSGFAVLSSLYLGFPCDSVGEESACNTGDLSLIPGSRRSPGDGNGNPIQYPCLENSMDRVAWRAYSPWGTKSWT